MIKLKGVEGTKRWLLWCMKCDDKQISFRKGERKLYCPFCRSPEIYADETNFESPHVA